MPSRPHLRTIMTVIYLCSIVFIKDAIGWNILSGSQNVLRYEKANLMVRFFIASFEILAKRGSASLAFSEAAIHILRSDNKLFDFHHAIANGYVRGSTLFKTTKIFGNGSAR